MKFIITERQYKIIVNEQETNPNQQTNYSVTGTIKEMSPSSWNVTFTIQNKKDSFDKQTIVVPGKSKDEAYRNALSRFQDTVSYEDKYVGLEAPKLEKLKII